MSLWLVVILVAIVLATGVAMAITRAGTMAPATPDSVFVLPGDTVVMAAEDVIGLRFDLAARGYRTDEVDDALDRLTVELAERDALIIQLGGEIPAERSALPSLVDAISPAVELGTDGGEPGDLLAIETVPDQVGSAPGSNSLATAETSTLAPGGEPSPAEPSPAGTEPAEPSPAGTELAETSPAETDLAGERDPKIADG